MTGRAVPSAGNASRRFRPAYGVLLVGLVVAAVSQVGVWWVRGFGVICTLSDPPECGLAIGRTGAATVATALTLLTLVVLVAVCVTSLRGRQGWLRTAFVAHVLVCAAAVFFTLTSTGFVVPT